MTFDKFYQNASILAKEKKWRMGQAIFNLLLDVKPSLAEQIRCTNLDPFFMSGPKNGIEKWDKCISFIKNNWEK